jgi:hypothetical protein
VDNIENCNVMGGGKDYGIRSRKLFGQFIFLKIDSLFQQTCVEVAPGADVLH